MIELMIIIVIGMLVWPLIVILFKTMLGMIILLFGTMFICMFLGVYKKHRKRVEIEKHLNIVTNKVYYNTLPLEDKKKICRLIELYVTNEEPDNDLKDSLLNMALGYTIGGLGIEKSIRYGVGYTLLRRVTGMQRNYKPPKKN